MSDQVDTGFDAVLAGEKWEAPAEEKADPAPPVTAPDPKASQLAERLPTSDGAGSGAVPITVAVNQPEPPAQSAPLPTTGLSEAGVQAAKALVQLPAIDWPTLAKLARDIAMDIKERHVVLAEYKLTQAQYDFLEANNEFYRNALSAASIEWHAPLSTSERIKVEAAAILEDSLPGLGARMQNKSEGLPGVIEAAKLFAKVAGVGERETGGAGSGERFTINIDLGGDQKISVSTSSAAPDTPSSPVLRAIPTD